MGEYDQQAAEAQTGDNEDDNVRSKRRLKRKLRKEEEEDNEDLYCSGDWYGSSSVVDPHEINYNSIWKTKDADSDNPVLSALDMDALYEMCLTEERTLMHLEELEACYKCPVYEEDGTISPIKKCLQPYSLVSIARLYLNFINNGVPFKHRDFLIPPMTCEDLRSQWTPSIQEQFISILKGCTNYILEQAKLKPLPQDSNGQTHYSTCASDPPIMTATLVDDQFLQTSMVKYTSSIYATKKDETSVKAMYEMTPDLVSSLEHSTLLEGRYEVGVNSLYSTGEQGFYEASFQRYEALFMLPTGLFVVTIFIQVFLSSNILFPQ